MTGKAKINRARKCIIASVCLLASLVPSTMKYKSNIMRSYKDIFLNFKGDQIDPWGIFVYTILLIAIVLMIYGIRYSKKKSDL